MKKTRKSIIEMTSNEAKAFLLKSESYITQSLPAYLDMEAILNVAKDMLKKKSIQSLSIADKKKQLSTHENVNHLILANKDGNYAWRPIELIHPLLYVDLVNIITKKDDWKVICERVKQLHTDSLVECISLPVESHSEKSDKAEAILNWWENLEQAQISHALKYEYCGHTDVSNCYDSIYTHTISWAIHTKEWAKLPENRPQHKGIGNRIDAKIAHMRHGQTNGIPQGSVLMDFIAEVVLSYADLKLTTSLKKLNLSDFYIMRYRDDYRIFSNSKDTVERIIKALSETLAEINMKLNTSKTFISSDIIKDAIKPDKLYWDVKRSSLEYKESGKIGFKLSIQKHLIQIKLLADKYPHSGSIRRALSDIYKHRISELDSTPDDINQLISITIDIMIKNPNTIEHCVVILSKLVTLIEKDRISEIIDKITCKFESTPNTDFVELWLQRLSIVDDRDKAYNSKICKKIKKPSQNSLWNSDWLIDGFDESKVINEEYINDMKITMLPNEIDLFANIYDLDEF